MPRLCTAHRCSSTVQSQPLSIEEQTTNLSNNKNFMKSMEDAATHNPQRNTGEAPTFEDRNGFHTIHSPLHAHSDALEQQRPHNGPSLPQMPTEIAEQHFSTEGKEKAIDRQCLHHKDRTWLNAEVCHETVNHVVLDSLFVEDTATTASSLPLPVRISPLAVGLRETTTAHRSARIDCHSSPQRVRPTSTRTMTTSVVECDTNDKLRSDVSNEDDGEELFEDVRTADLSHLPSAVPLRRDNTNQQPTICAVAANVSASRGANNKRECQRRCGWTPPHEPPALRAPLSSLTPCSTAESLEVKNRRQHHHALNRNADEATVKPVLSAAYHKENKKEKYGALAHVGTAADATKCNVSSILTTPLRVQVWVPRRVERLCRSPTTAAMSPSLTERHEQGLPPRQPQPVIWRRPDASELEQPHTRQQHQCGDPKMSSSPLSSTQWCVTAFEVVEVCPCVISAEPRSSSNKPNTNTMKGTFGHADRREPTASHSVSLNTKREIFDTRRGVDDRRRISWPKNDIDGTDVRPYVRTREPNTDDSTSVEHASNADWNSNGDGTSSSSYDESEEEEDAAAMPTSVTDASRRSVLCTRTNDVEEEEEETAAGGDTYRNKAALRRGRSRHRRDDGSCDHRIRRVEPQQHDNNENNDVARHEAHGHGRHAGHTSSFSSRFPCLYGSASSLLRLQQKPLSEFRITLSWLLHACTLPPVASTLLSRGLEAHVCTSVSLSGKVCSSSGDQVHKMSSRFPRSPLPFWIAVFAYTRDIQARATLFTSRLVHEAETTTVVPHRTSSSSTDLPRCIPWPQWVPTVQWSTHVLAALTSAAFVLINDVAHALSQSSAASIGGNQQGFTEAETDPLSSTAATTASSRSKGLRRLLNEFHVFCEVVFGDMENKKLCRHVRDRLPVHINDLSELLNRPWCDTATKTPETVRCEATCATSSRDGTVKAEDAHNPSHPINARREPKGNESIRHIHWMSPPSLATRRTTASSSSAAAVATDSNRSRTRCPSMLDLVHHLAHAWMRQCFPALVSDLHVFLMSHDPGVVIDQWCRSLNSPCESSEIKSFLTSTDAQLSKDSHVEAGTTTATSRLVRISGKSLTAIASPYDLHYDIYEGIHDFVRGVLHRWEFWADPFSASQLVASHTYGTELQWRTHVNYAKMQSLHWILLHHHHRHSPVEIYSDECHANHHRSKRDDDGAVAFTNHTSAEDVMQTNLRSHLHVVSGNSNVTDMEAVLEQLTILPILFESALLLPGEIHDGLRRACAAAAHLTALERAESHKEGSRTCFRVFFGMVCYGASMLSEDDAAAVLRAFTHPSPCSNAFPRTSTAPSSPTTTHRHWDKQHGCSGDVSTKEVTAEAARCVADIPETVGGIWKGWILPLVVRYYEGCCTRVGQDQEQNREEKAEGTTSDIRTEVVTLSGTKCSTPSPQPWSVLMLADQMVAYALTLLQLVRDAQRRASERLRSSAIAAVSTTASSATSSRKRHRRSSSDRPHHRSSFQRCRHDNSPTEIKLPNVRVSSKGGEEKGDAENSSLCSPCTLSSYATASTATAFSLAHGHHQIHTNNDVDWSGKGRNGETEKREEVRDVNSRRDSTTQSTTNLGGGTGKSAMIDAPRGAAPTAVSSSTLPVRILPFLQPLRHTEDKEGIRGGSHAFPPEILGRPSSSCRHAGQMSVLDWRDVCRTVALQWLSPPSPQQQEEDLRLPTTASRERYCCTGHVIHRRDVRHVRAFLLSLQRCIQQQLQCEQQRQQEHANDRKEKQSHDVQLDERAGLYDYLYGVSPPGLHAGGGGVMVLEVTPSPSASSTPSTCSFSSSFSSSSRPLERERMMQEEDGWTGAIQHGFHRRTHRGPTHHHNNNESGEEILHLTSTDSLSLSSEGSVKSNASSTPTEKGEMKNDEQRAELDVGDWRCLPSSSTTPLSSLSVSSTSSQCSPVCSFMNSR